MPADRSVPAAATPGGERAVIALGVLVGCIPALQPLLLGGLLGAGKITAPEIGVAGTCEGLGMLAGTTLATLFLRPRGLQVVAGVSLFVVAAANLLTGFGPADLILPLRASSGIASGVILWLLVQMLTRAEAPGRLFAGYVLTQAVLAFLLSQAFARAVLPGWGIGGAYGLLAALALIVAPLLSVVPRAFPDTSGGLRLPARAGVPALFAVTLFLAGILAFWIYLLPLAGALGHEGAAAGEIVSSAIAAQVAGAAAALFLASRIDAVRLTVWSPLACAGLVALALLAGENTAILQAAAFAFAFLWMMAPPFHLPMLLSADGGGRSAAFVSVAQLGGVSLGPLLASLGVARGGALAAGWVSIGAFLISAILAVSVLARLKAARG